MISLDDISYLEYDVLGGLNLFTYCNNNPVMYVDPDGKFFLTALLIGAVIGFAFGGGIAIGKEIYNNGWNPANWNWRNIGADALTGAALGLSLSAGGLVGVGAISGFGAVGAFVGTTAISYGAGMGAYAIKYAGESSVTYRGMFDYARKTAVNSMFNFAAGYLFGKVGAWNNIGDEAFSKIRSEVLQTPGIKHAFANTLGIYSKQFGMQIAERSLVRSGIWWLLNEL